MNLRRHAAIRPRRSMTISTIPRASDTSVFRWLLPGNLRLTILPLTSGIPSMPSRHLQTSKLCYRDSHTPMQRATNEVMAIGYPLGRYTFPVKCIAPIIYHSNKKVQRFFDKKRSVPTILSWYIYICIS